MLKLLRLLLLMIRESLNLYERRHGFVLSGPHNV
jgi:hypothetical protein